MALTTDALLKEFITKNATDLYLTVGATPSIRLHYSIDRIGTTPLAEDDIVKIMRDLVTEANMKEFETTHECNTAIDWKEGIRLRINIFRQRRHIGAVIRRIRTDIPTLESLGLPKQYAELIMEKRGLILVVGTTGSGKSTSLAAMLEHRNVHGSGHIVTIEDPIEFTHEHRNCIITQRDVGIDTNSFAAGLKNALRQTPDVIVIGEIRDEETMDQAIVFAETGHLCLATMHSTNAHQAIERVINFFPQEKHAQVLQNLSLNLKAVLSQRLVNNTRNTRSIAIEILLNQGLIKNLIQEGRIKEIRDQIEKSREVGMQTFEQSLLDLYVRGLIKEEVALAESDSPATLRLAIRQFVMSKQHGSLYSDKDAESKKSQF